MEINLHLNICFFQQKERLQKCSVMYCCRH